MAGTNWTDLMETAESAPTSFAPVPPADYDVRVHSAEPSNSSTGKQMIKIVYVIENGPYVNKRVFNNMVISPDSPTAMSIFFRHMAAHGLDKTYFNTNPSLPAVAAAMLNRRVRLTVGIKKYNGDDRNEVKGVKSAVTPLASAPPGYADATTVAPPAPLAPVYAAPAAAPAPAPAPVYAEPAPAPVAAAPAPPPVYAAPAPAPVYAAPEAAAAPPPPAPAPAAAPAPAPAPAPAAAPVGALEPPPF